MVTGPSIVFETVTVTVMALLVLPTVNGALSVQLTPDAGGWQVQPVPLTAVKVKGRRERVRPANIITRDRWIALTTEVATSEP